MQMTYEVLTLFFTQKFTWRLGIVRDPAFPALHCHRPLYETLGVEGMSSEEDCPGPCPPRGEPTRRVYRKTYLSGEVRQLNAHIDDIHAKRWGPRPCPRAVSMPKVCTRWIPNLPINAYDKYELAQLPSESRMRLQMRLNAHTFTYHIPGT